MTEPHNKMCDRRDAYLDGDLDYEASETFKQHVLVCQSCQDYLGDYSNLKQAVLTFEAERIPDEVELQVRHVLHQQIHGATPDNEILDIEGVAHLLALPLTEIVSHLAELPSFEFAGRLRFRRDRILEWAEERERAMFWERGQVRSESRSTIILFTGEQSC